MAAAQAEKPKATQRPVAFPLRLAALLAAALLAGAGPGARASCGGAAGGKQVALSFRYRTNASDHQQVNARLEQHSRNSEWQLDFEVGCLPGQGQEDLRVLTLSLSGQPTAGQPPCSGCRLPANPPPGYYFIPGVGYIRPAREFVEWEVANATCVAEGATLAMPTSLEAARTLVGFLNWGPSGNMQHGLWAWIGATDHVQENNWVSVTGIPLSQMGVHKWNAETGEPNGGRGENCMVAQKNTGHLGDAPCNWKLAYACQLNHEFGLQRRDFRLSGDAAMTKG